MTDLLDKLTAARSSGRKLLVPYLMGAIPDRLSYPDALRAIEEHADVVEVGLPYSDPLMDGPVIAAAGERVIASGIGPLEVIRITSEIEVGKPRVAMTYYNPIHHLGESEFCSRLSDAGFTGLIVPDLPIEESAGLRDAASASGLAWIPLVAPTSSPERVKKIVSTATGFVYAVSTLGVTGERGSLSERAAKVVAACRAETDLPVLIGIGITNAEQAAEAAAVADGVVVGSAVVRIVLDQGAQAAGDFVSNLRAALDVI
ncbi:MAG: tryptophan synthase alpha chain [Actinomycetota bacterium]|nr:tryptophan synthase alpha chain [Actinomycetota bacterium]